MARSPRCSLIWIVARSNSIIMSGMDAVDKGGTIYQTSLMSDDDALCITCVDIDAGHLGEVNLHRLSKP